MKCVMKRRPGLAALQLSEQHVVGLERLRATAFRLRMLRGCRSTAALPIDGDAIGIELGEAFDDEIGKAGDGPIVFGLPVSLSKTDTAIDDAAPGRSATENALASIMPIDAASTTIASGIGHPVVERLGAACDGSVAAGASAATGAMNLNPRLGIVWTKRGLSPLSPSAVRICERQ